VPRKLPLVVVVAGCAFFEERPAQFGERDDGIGPRAFSRRGDLHGAGASGGGFAENVGQVAGLFSQHVGEVGCEPGLGDADDEEVREAVACETVQGGGSVPPFLAQRMAIPPVYLEPDSATQVGAVLESSA